MKRNKILKICLIMALAVAVVAFAMSRTSVLKASETGDANYGETVPTAETATQYISIPQGTEAEEQAPEAEASAGAALIQEPTEAPAEEPTEAPAEEPTEAPAEEPTEAPAEEPTEAPAEEPTEAPAEEPTEAPAEEATEAPAEEPTEAPAEEPTEAPAEEPTEAPAEEPTEVPVGEFIVTIEVENLSGGDIAIGSKVRLKAMVEGADEETELHYEWYYSTDEIHWEKIPEATEDHYDLTVDEVNGYYSWKVIVTK